jgi:hypothetical protein
MKRILIISVVFVMAIAMSSVSMAGEDDTQVKGDDEIITLEVTPITRVEEFAPFAALYSALPIDDAGKLILGWVSGLGESFLNNQADKYAAAYSDNHVLHGDRAPLGYECKLTRKVIFEPRPVEERNSGASARDSSKYMATKKANYEFLGKNATLADIKKIDIQGYVGDAPGYTGGVNKGDNYFVNTLTFTFTLKHYAEYGSSVYGIFPNELYLVGTKAKHDIEQIARKEKLTLEIFFESSTYFNTEGKYEISAPITVPLFKRKLRPKDIMFDDNGKLQNLIPKKTKPVGFIPYPITKFMNINVKVVETSNIKKLYKWGGEQLGKLFD